MNCQKISLDRQIGTENASIFTHRSEKIYANIATLVLLVKILVSFIFTFLGMYVFFSFLIFFTNNNKRKEAEEVGVSDHHLRKYALNSACAGEPLKIVKGKTKVAKYEPSRAAQVVTPRLLTSFPFPGTFFLVPPANPEVKLIGLNL